MVMHPRLLCNPHLFDVATALKQGDIYWQNGRELVVRCDQKKQVIPQDAYFDLAPATMHSLAERLTLEPLSPKLSGGDSLRAAFEQEYAAFNHCEQRSSPDTQAYGVWAWYPAARELVRYVPAWWHQVALTASAGMLYRDVERRLSWQELRTLLSSCIVGVAGCSVGSSVIHALVSDLRPRAIKIADRSRYKMENANRVRITYRELRDASTDVHLSKKAPTVAAQLTAIDPFLQVYVYDEGITSATIKDFFDGDGTEPAINIVVDEVDDPGTKVLLREEARKRSLPLVMVTDLGSTVQLDVQRFDLDPTLPLTYGTSDAVLYAARDRAEQSNGDRLAFFNYVDALIGPQYRQDELGEIVAGRTERLTETLFAQLGSTVMVAGGIAAETIARWRLGYACPPRQWFDKRHGRVSLAKCI